MGKLSKYWAVMLAIALCAGFAACTEEEEEYSPITKISMEPTLSIWVGGTRTLTLEIEPNWNFDVKWSSTNERVASVVDGQVTGISVGNAQITAEVEGQKATCQVTVTEGPDEVEPGEDGTILTLDLDACADKDEVKQKILEADAQGVSHYILKGQFGKLGILTVEVSDELVYNPFKDTQAKSIDFTEVTGFPNIKYNDGEEQKGPGIPIKMFHPNCPELRKIILPNEVIAIGEEAFVGCPKLESVTMNNVRYIGGSAFEDL